MFETFTPETRRAYDAAVEEARRSGYRRVGTEHLLLGLLTEPDDPAARALGVTLETARATLDRLDGAALAAVGVEVGGFGGGPLPAAPKRATLSSGAKAVLARARATADAAPAKSRRITTKHYLEALLACDQPDPAAILLGELKVDAAEVRSRLGESGS